MPKVRKNGATARPGRAALPLRLLFAAVAAFFPAAANAAGVYDLNPANAAPPPLPTFVGAGDSPVYITNTNAEGLRGEGAIDSLRIGQRAAFAIGFDAAGAAGAAGAPVGVNVAGDAVVEGQLRVGTLGRRADEGAWLPAAPTPYASGLGVAGLLAVERGGLLLVEGGSETGSGEGGEGGAAVEHSGVVASRMRVNGGSAVINSSGELHVGDPAASGGGPSLTIANGGRVLVNSGLPSRDVNEITAAEGDPWAFKGLRLAGGGIEIGAGGVLASGSSGGVVDGFGAGSAMTVLRGGLLDASRGDLLARNLEQITIEGAYRAGAGNQLTSENGTVVFGADSRIAFSADLLRGVNSGGIGAGADIVRGGDIVFANGLPAIRTGMGFYTLGLFPFEEPPAPPADPPESAADPAESLFALHESGTGSILRIVQADRAVAGSGSAADRALFRDNLNTIWADAAGNRFGADQAEIIYDLHASAYPAITASGESGTLNKNILEGLMNGPGAPVPGGGQVDQGVFELYNGAAQWAAGNVAMNTAELFMAGIDRRVHRIGAELDRQGEYASAAYAPDGAGRRGRFWKGSLYSEEQAGLDGGVSGYTYRPRGLILGYDHTAGGLSLGAAAAYAHGDFNDRAASGDASRIDSYSAGLFASYHGAQGFNASAFATLSALDNDLSDTRGGMRREADFTSRAYSVGGRLGYDMALADRLIVQPSIGITHAVARAKSHDEFLNGVHIMRVGEVTRSGALAPIDVALGYDLLRSEGALLRLNVNAGYAYDFDGAAPEGTLTYSGLSGAPGIAVAGREGGRHRINLGAGLVFTAEKFDVTARYDYARKESQSNHQAKTSVGMKF